MAGTIYSGSYMGGIVLDDPATQLPATVTGSVSNTDGDAILGRATVRWTVANQGTIQSTGTAGYGIDLVASGTVENGDSGATAALISGYGGVVIRGKLATVANYATIEATGSKRNGVELRNGGRVTNGGTGATAAQISGGRHAVAIRNAAGTVRNFGTLTGTGIYNVVALFAGGSVTNGSNASTKALISGSASGVDVDGAAGTVVNFGTIEGGRGVALRAGGRVTNGSAAATGALISATRKGVYISGAAGTVTNFGTIQGTGRGSYGVNLATTGTIVNLGTITSGKQAAVRLTAGGKVTNGSTDATGALIRGGYFGVYIADGAGTVTNLGTIQGADGVALRNGGRVTNGSTTSTGALISGDGEGVLIAGAAGTVSNFGTIDGGGYSVRLSSGGRITNGSATSTSALIHGVYISGTAGTVSNFGTIDGVVLLDGGRVTNGSAASTGALISGGSYGVLVAAGTVGNFGTIRGGVVGVEIDNGAGVTNFGTISGGQYGVFCPGGTVTNFGTISGGSSGTAVRSAARVGSKVVVEPGALFIGSVLGGGVSEIDFVAGGVADLGNVSGFATIGLSSGRHHTLTLTGTNFAAVVGAAITVDDGNAGNTVTAAALPAKDRIIVHAGAGLDKLTGGKGNDVFYAGGDTVMTGKAGKNEFIFSAPGGNTVAGFAVSATNEIVFSDQGFSLGLSGATGTPQALPTGLVVENSDGHFTSTSQNFAYATGTGDLFYSASGSSGTPALVSHFTAAPALAATQLFFIA